MKRAEYPVMMEELIPLMRERLDAGQLIRFSPRGISMLPMLRQGRDQVTLSPITGQLKKYDLVLYERDNGQYVLHRIVKAGEPITCIGDNQYAPEPGLRRDQMIAVVSAFTRNGREVSVSHPGYRLYCRVWHGTRGLRRFLERALRFLRRKLRKS